MAYEIDTRLHIGDTGSLRKARLLEIPRRPYLPILQARRVSRVPPRTMSCSTPCEHGQLLLVPPRILRKQHHFSPRPRLWGNTTGNLSETGTI